MNSDKKKDYANDGQLLRTYTDELQLQLYLFIYLISTRAIERDREALRLCLIMIW